LKYNPRLFRRETPECRCVLAHDFSDDLYTAEPRRVNSGSSDDRDPVPRMKPHCVEPVRKGDIRHGRVGAALTDGTRCFIHHRDQHRAGNSQEQVSREPAEVRGHTGRTEESQPKNCNITADEARFYMHQHVESQRGATHQQQGPHLSQLRNSISARHHQKGQPCRQ
jgi:hypothetical protein